MKCPKCRYLSTVAVDSRKCENYTRRRRKCVKCEHRFTTYEIIPEPKVPEYVRKLLSSAPAATPTKGA